jgi:hypothetical protein
MQQDQWSARFIGDLRATLNNYASTLGYTPEDVKRIGKDLETTSVRSRNPEGLKAHTTT